MLSDGLEKLNKKHSQEMVEFGASLSSRIQSPRVIALHGNLGAGKTTFAKGFISARTGLALTDITSPTFQYVHFYPFGVVHFDLWRLKGIDEFLGLGLEEHLQGGVVLIEWPDRIHSLIPDNAVHIDIEICEDGRVVTIRGM
jgi:tRNA threonylcarbamoyl adenosine modification protein YjeE